MGRAAEFSKCSKKHKAEPAIHDQNTKGTKQDWCRESCGGWASTQCSATLSMQNFNSRVLIAFESEIWLEQQAILSYSPQPHMFIISYSNRTSCDHMPVILTLSCCCNFAPAPDRLHGKPWWQAEFHCWTSRSSSKAPTPWKSKCSVMWLLWHQDSRRKLGQSGGVSLRIPSKVSV